MDAIDLNSVAQEVHDSVEDTQSFTHFQFSDTARREFTAYEYWGFWDINDGLSGLYTHKASPLYVSSLQL